MSSDLRDLAEEARATIDFFVSQSQGSTVDRVLLTGGASQTSGLANAVAGDLSASVMTVDPLAQLDCSALEYTPEEMSRISASATTAIGLALWHAEAPLIRLSVLPEEVARARKATQLVTMAGVSLAALVGVLAVAGAGEFLAVHAAQNKVHSAEARVTALTAEQSELNAKASVHSEVLARQSLDKQALAGDVDWVRVMGQLAAAMPSNLYLSSIQGNRSTSNSSSQASGVGTMNFSVTGTGGLPTASQWIAGLSGDPDVSNIWVSSITVNRNGGAVKFSSDVALTPNSESKRDQEVGK
jgi:Tfp pilus assembly protein PilN